MIPAQEFHSIVVFDDAGRLLGQLTLCVRLVELQYGLWDELCRCWCEILWQLPLQGELVVAVKLESKVSRLELLEVGICRR